jgi:hypothetical protein
LVTRRPIRARHDTFFFIIGVEVADRWRAW